MPQQQQQHQQWLQHQQLVASLVSALVPPPPTALTIPSVPAAAAGKPRGQGRTRHNKDSSQEWLCRCGQNNWTTRQICRGCRAKNADLGRAGRERGPQKPKSPPPAPQKPQKQPGDGAQGEDVWMDANEGSPDAEDPVWASLTLRELKAELAKLEALNRQLKDHRCVTVANELGPKIGLLKLHMQKRLPQTQQLEVLGAQLRKAQAQREKAVQAEMDAKLRLEECAAKAAQLAEEERQAQRALDDLKQQVAAQPESDDSPPAGGDSLAEIDTVLSALNQQVPPETYLQTKTLLERLRVKAQSGPPAQLMPSRASCCFAAYIRCQQLHQMVLSLC